MLEGTKDELAALNKRRKALILEVNGLRKQQEHHFSKIQQDVSTYLDDHGEKYFLYDGEWAGKLFAQRFDASLKAMRAEIKALELVIGINLHDMDEELDRGVAKLSAKEKEFDSLEDQLRMPVRETKEYKDLMAKYLTSTSLSFDPDKEYARLHRSLAKKETYEEELNSIIDKRERQLEKELQNVRQVFKEQRSQKRSLLETIAQSTAKELDSKRHQYRQQIDAERESIVKRAEMDQADLHAEFVKRYQTAMAALKPPPAIGEADAIEVESKGPVAGWKAEVMNRQEEVMQHAREQREEEYARDQQLLQSLRAKQQYVLDPTPLADIASKLGALYLRYNDAMMEPDRRRKDTLH